MARFLTATIFAALFALFFIALGIRRMIGSVREPRPAEAMFWGIVGVLLGIGTFVGLWYVGQSIADDAAQPPPFRSSFPPIPAPR